MTTPAPPQPWPPECQLWPVDPGCALPEGWEVDPQEWPEAQQRAMMLASEWLHLRTAKAYGLCLVHVRPCRRTRPPCGELAGGWPFQPALYDGRLINITCGCVGSCDCGPLCEIPLPGPVYSIQQVLIDGEIVPAGTYRVDNHNRLVRTGGDCWPDTQDLRQPDNMPGTWSVLFWYGREITPLGRLAVTKLAIEFAKYCGGDNTCVLPERVTQIVRQGVTYTLETAAGHTNIKLVDDWVNLVNPYGLTEDFQVWSPDVDYGRFQTSPRPWDAQPPGPSEPPGSTTYFRWVQASPALIWTIVHNLGMYPGGITVEDDTGADVNGFEVTYPDINTVRLTFNQATAGVAYLS